MNEETDEKLMFILLAIITIVSYSSLFIILLGGI